MCLLKTRGCDWALDLSFLLGNLYVIMANLNRSYRVNRNALNLPTLFVNFPWSLLNQPEAWLGNLFRKYKLAERALGEYHWRSLSYLLQYRATFLQYKLYSSCMARFLWKDIFGGWRKKNQLERDLNIDLRFNVPLRSTTWAIQPYVGSLPNLSISLLGWGRLSQAIQPVIAS